MLLSVHHWILLLFTSLFALPAFADHGPYTYQTYSLNGEYTAGVDYKKQTAIIKLKPFLRSQAGIQEISNPRLSAAFEELEVYSIQKRYPHQLPPTAGSKDELGRPFVDLSLIYTIRYHREIDIESALNHMLKTGTLVYAVPDFNHHKTYTPNDNNLSSQYYLDSNYALQMPSAWALTKGDTNVTIAVVDDGFDMDHPDMQSQYQINWDEIPNNVIDDDNDGYVDNYKGIDLAGHDYNNLSIDSDPSAVGSNTSHGVHVSGIAGAATDNSVGVAGTGFNCRIMPVKATADNDIRSGGRGLISSGYDGIEFAATTGADIINCSWGGGSDSPFEIDIINYAIINEGATVVAAAGNNGADREFYPASYQDVIGVVSVGTSQVKSNFSNYNYQMDVAAPGENIYNNDFDDDYRTASGTSMASPVVAGILGLIKSRYPAYTNYQLGARLRSTSTDLYTILANRARYGKMGNGHANAYRALSMSVPGFRILDTRMRDNNDQLIGNYDTVRIQFDLKNLLDQSSPQTIARISTDNSLVTMLKDSVYLGSVQSGDTIQTNPFEIRLGYTASLNREVNFLLIIEDTNYREIIPFQLRVNRTYLDIKVNEAKTSLTGRGRLGYDSDGLSEYGLGFNYKRNQMLYECGMMMVADNNTMSNTVRSTAGAAVFDNEFFNTVPVQLQPQPWQSDWDLYGQFTDSVAANPVGVDVVFQSYAWDSAGYEDFVIFNYKVINRRAQSITGLHLGFYADWDISNSGQEDRGRYDSTRHLGYTYSIQDTSDQGPFGGIRMLHSVNQAQFYGIDNDHENNPTIGVYDGFTDTEKRNTLTSGLARTEMGQDSIDGNDVSFVLGDGPYTLPAGDTLELAFALIGGLDEISLKAHADSAQSMFERLDTRMFTTTKSILQEAWEEVRLYPNPARNHAYLNWKGGEEQARLRIWNRAGQVLHTDLNYQKGTALRLDNLPNGQYLIELRQADRFQIKPLVVE